MALAQLDLFTGRVDVRSLRGAVGFDELDYTESIGYISTTKTYQQALLFRAGDHYQEGKAWIGPEPDPENDHSDELWNDIERIIVPHPGFDEVVDRARDATTSEEPTWAFVPRRALQEGQEPNPDETTRIEELNSFLTGWWDEQEVLGQLQLLAEDAVLGGRGVMEIAVPEGELAEQADGTPTVPSGTFEQQLRRIFPLFIRADQATVTRDPITLRKVGVYSYTTTERITGGQSRSVRLTYLDAQGRTVVRTLREGAGESERWVGDLGGHLLMFEARTNPLITEPLLRNQMLANLGCTMMASNAVVGGFLERLFLNGMVPGEWVKDKDGKEVYKEHDYKVGPKTTNWIAGMVTGQDADGNDIVANPSVIYREPVSPATFTETIMAAYRNVLAAARQVHALITGDATTSGESRKQARDDFAKSLKRLKTRIDALGRWLLETVVKLAATFAGDPTRYDDLRATFSCKLDLGPMSAEDQKASMLEVEAELLSEESYMTAVGRIQDYKAEKLKIAAEVRAKRERDAKLDKEFPPPAPAGSAPPTPPGDGGGDGGGTGGDE